VGGTCGRRTAHGGVRTSSGAEGRRHPDASTQSQSLLRAWWQCCDRMVPFTRGAQPSRPPRTWSQNTRERRGRHEAKRGTRLLHNSVAKDGVVDRLASGVSEQEAVDLLKRLARDACCVDVGLNVGQAA